MPKPKVVLNSFSLSPMSSLSLRKATIVPIDEHATIITQNADSLLSQAVAAGAGIDTLERLMALRKEMLAEEAKKAFNIAMAAFQAECPVIKKTKEVKTNAGKVAYKYAPIESAVIQVKELIQKHGFRYSTTMELNEGRVKAFCRVVHTLGHEEVSEMEVPLGNKTDIMSQSQVVAAASTFAKRYAFLNAFGIMTGDEDNDTADQRGDAPVVPPKKVTAPKKPEPKAKAKPSVTQVLEFLTKCKTAEGLNTTFDTAMKHAWDNADKEAIEECRMNVLEKISKSS